MVQFQEERTSAESCWPGTTVTVLVPSGKDSLITGLPSLFFSGMRHIAGAVAEKPVLRGMYETASFLLKILQLSGTF